MQKCDVNLFNHQGALGEGASQAGGEAEEERGGRQQERPRLLRVLPQGGEGEVGQIHRLSSACGRSFVCFIFGLRMLKNKAHKTSTTSG